ncbi:MAG TPA: DinB family protein, partial [Thermoanaerobaculia bacterium]|nr:DinB family protein [Thermoanaerobaculia bacterium]
FAALPEEVFSWRPGDGEFSCGDLLRHLIQAERFWVRLLTSAARGEVYDPFGLGDLDLASRVEAFRQPNERAAGDERFGATFAAGLELWSEQEALSRSRIAEIPAAALGRSVTHPLSGLTASVEEMLWVMIEHEAHHRGQISAYMKVLEVAHPADLWS